MPEYDKDAAAERLQARTKELTDKLEAGMKELYDSDKYKNYLKSMSYFHAYSCKNIMLIKIQNPDATRIASYKVWKEKFNRQVKKGEKGLYIYAPITTKKPETKMMEKLDKETGAPLIDENGNVIMEEMTALSSGVRFKLVPTFDVSQTEGDPLPELAESITGNVAHFNAFVDALKSVSPLPIEFEQMQQGKDGYCRYGVKIGIREGMSEVQTVGAIVHELAHARLHDMKNTNKDIDVKKTKSIIECEAESLSYVICKHYDIDTAQNSFGYLAEYMNREMAELTSSLDLIRKESNALINAIDYQYGIICKERGINLSAKNADYATDKPEQTTTEPTKKDNKPEPNPLYTTVCRVENIAGTDFVVNDVIPLFPDNDYKKAVEQQNYQKLIELFPNIVSHEYNYMRLEAGTGMEPLSLEWIGDNRLSIMHTYIQNGDLMYDPMIVLDIDHDANTAAATQFEQSSPPLYQWIHCDGTGHSVDGNGNERTVNNLQEEINDFTSKWLNNIKNQDYKTIRASLQDDELNDTSVYFNVDGKPFNISYIQENDKITAYNRLDSNGPHGMKEIAVIDVINGINLMDEILPPAVVDMICEKGNEFSNHKNSPETNNMQANEVTAINTPLPDPSITPADRNSYGYTADDMLPLTADKAQELFDSDHTIYLLYPDDTESMVFEREEIGEFNNGLFGITKSDWERSPVYTSLLAANDKNEAALESEFLHSKNNSYAIYQLKDIDETRAIRFESMESLMNKGFAVDRGNYELTYTAPMPDSDTLEAIYQRFNVNRPADFTGHSLSVSDIIVIQKDGSISSHYVDRFGFSELSSFLGMEKQDNIPGQLTNEREVIERNNANAQQITAAETQSTQQTASLDLLKRDQPVYKSTLHYAEYSGDQELYHTSMGLNIECGRAIDQAIIDSNYKLYHYDLKKAVNAVIDEYGIDRTAWVLAANINYHNHDGRLSNGNKTWAICFDTGEPDVYLKTHLTILDGFTDRFREAAERKPSLLNALESSELLSKQQYTINANSIPQIIKNTKMEVI